MVRRELFGFRAVGLYGSGLWVEGIKCCGFALDHHLRNCSDRMSDVYAFKARVSVVFFSSGFNAGAFFPKGYLGYIILIIL